MIKSHGSNVRYFLLLTAYCLLLTLFSLIPAGNAYAHKVQMFVHVEGEQVFLEGYFPDGTKTVNSEVIVSDNKSGKELLKGKTDDAGKFSFKSPVKTDLKIALNASLGHKTEYILPGNELADKADNKSDKKAGTNKIDKENKASGQTSAASQFDPSELQLAVEKGVEKGVTPLMRSFSDCKEHVFSSEIIGGIGYIFGILGIVLYFQSRKKK
ncbi:MAG: hypothetical protein PH343_01570 [Nitrospira sp.]|nr:hypothetical protein [Nitrospira sp.]